MIGAANTAGTVVGALERFAREMAEYTHGRARIQVNAGTPDDASAIAQVQQGQATLGWIRVAEIADMAPELSMLTVPFLFADQQKALSLLEATWLGPLLNDQLRRQGLEPLAFMNAGSLRLAGSAASSFAASQGQQITMRPGKLRVAAFEALGLQPLVEMPKPEQIATTPLVELRSDDLAGLQSPPPALVDTVHANDLVVVVANRERFAELPLDIRETTKVRLQEAAAAQRGAAIQADAIALANLRQQGANIVSLPEEQRRQAHDKVKANIATAVKNADPSVLATVLAYAD